MNNRELVLASALLGMLLALVGHPVAADEANKGRAGPGASVQSASSNVGKLSADRAIAAAAQRAGMQRCGPLSDRVTRYLIGESKSAGVLFVAPQTPNDRLSSASIEVESNRTLAYASATYAPYGEAGCGVAYDAVTYSEDSCVTVAAKNLNNLRPLGTLGDKIAMFEGGPQLRIYLMPAGSGCVQIKKEMLY